MTTRAILAAALLMAASAADAAIIFSDDFDDGDVSDWTFSTNHDGVAGRGVTTERFTSADYALETYLIAPPAGIDLVARASRTFATAAGDYTLSLTAGSAPCSGCTISYDVLLNGSSLTRASFTSGMESLSFTLTGLAAGNQTLTLGIHTTNASSGRFRAFFDDVQVEGAAPAAVVPEPATWATMVLGLGLAGGALRRRRRTQPA